MSQTKIEQTEIKQKVVEVNINEIINEFNNRVMEAHNAHYINGSNELIDLSDKASPNGNLIYHLYSNGEITHQKGAWAYLQRSEFNCKYDLPGARKIPFKFAKEALDGTSYVILTEDECITFREEMNTIINLYNNK